MYHIASCRDYKTIYHTHDQNEAITKAREISDSDPDNYATIIYQNGTIVGNCVDGITGPDNTQLPHHERCGSTLTGREW